MTRSPKRWGYAVVGLEALEGDLENATCTAPSARCSHNGRLHADVSLLHRTLAAATAGQHVAATTNIRFGIASSSYAMHHDGNSDNLLAQLSGHKRIWLAPPSQHAFAALAPDDAPDARHSHFPGARRISFVQEI